MQKFLEYHNEHFKMKAAAEFRDDLNFDKELEYKFKVLPTHDTCGEDWIKDWVLNKYLHSQC